MLRRCAVTLRQDGVQAAGGRGGEMVLRKPVRADLRRGGGRAPDGLLRRAWHFVLRALSRQHDRRYRHFRKYEKNDACVCVCVKGRGLQRECVGLSMILHGRVESPLANLSPEK